MSLPLRQDYPCDSPQAEAADDTVHVLIVDDDPAYQHLCKRYLSRREPKSYRVTTVTSAAEAYAACRVQEFDCILIDYVLPDTSGTKVIAGLRSIVDADATPTIIMTAGGGELAAADAVRAGATDFLSKRVVSAESLARAVDNAVEKGRLKKLIKTRRNELRAANLQLRAKNDEIQRFYQSVSHEVKTPLAAAREFVAIVLDGIAGPVTSEQEEMLNHALESCDQITSHFNDLVEMTRLDAAKVTMKKRSASLENVVTRCLASMSSMIRAKQIDLQTTIEAPLPLLYIDSNRVIQVLANLLGNAIKYTDPNGRIELTVAHAAPERRVRVAVSDNGCGIPESDLPHIFDRLYQVTGTGDDCMGAGLGLGLTIAKEIISLHGGSMAVESVAGQGSTFSFDLPVAESLFDQSEKSS